MVSADSLIEYVLIHYRWVFVIFLLPVSLLYDIWFYARNFIVFRLNSAPKKHPQKVQHVQAQVRQWRDSGCPQTMCTARPGWQTISPQNMAYKSKMCQIKIDLVDILDIDTEQRTVTCEPLVTMGQLTSTLDRLGWTIPIVPELDDLTVGGLIMGTGIETSSHKYGLFQHICVAYELVIADGSLLTCSAEENPDLFFAIPWSYGTLGFLVSAKIRIIPSKRFVRLNYHPCYSLEKALETLNDQLSRPDPCEFVECLVFAKNRAVVMTGDMVDSCELDKLNEIGKWHKPWFFKHVQSFLNRGPLTEYIPLRDYYHRHSRSIFWEIQDIIPFGNNVVFRYLMGWLIPPKVSLLKLTQGKTIKRLYEEKHVVQDMLAPIETAKNCLDFFDDRVEIYPIWLCPFKLFANPGMLKTSSGEDEMYLDIGVYGTPKRKGYNCWKTMRELEQFVRTNRGFQMMYADSYMTEEEFESMFDHSLYDDLRAKYNCDRAFPRVYHKVKKSARSSP